MYFKFISLNNKFNVEGNLKRLLSNAISAFMGNMGSSVLNILTMALVARFLGVSDFGILVIITTFLVIINTVVSFQTWQALIKYGNNLLNKKRVNDYARLITFGFKLDFTTSLLGFFITNAILLLLHYFDVFLSDYLRIAHFYSLVALVNIKGTPIAILRGWNKFNKVAHQQVILALLKLCFVIVAVFLDGNLFIFIVALLLAEVLGGVLLVFLSIRVIFNENIKLVSDVPFFSIANEHPGIWSFLISSSLNSSLRLGSREVDVFVVGLLLTAADVGVYKIAKQFSGIVGKIIDPLYQAVYPELVDLINKKCLKSLNKFVIRVTSYSSFASILIWLFIYFLGGYLIKMTVGEEFIEAYSIMIWYMTAVVISSSFFVLQPIMLSLGKPELSLKINLTSTLIYICAMLFLTIIYGTIGTAIAYIFYYLVWTLLMAFFVIKGVNKIENDL